MDIGRYLLPIISPSGTVSTISLSDLKMDLDLAPNDLYFETNICEGAGDTCTALSPVFTVTDTAITMNLVINAENTPLSNRCTNQYTLESSRGQFIVKLDSQISFVRVFINVIGSPVDFILLGQSDTTTRTYTIPNPQSTFRVEIAAGIDDEGRQTLLIFGSKI